MARAKKAAVKKSAATTKTAVKKGRGRPATKKKAVTRKKAVTKTATRGSSTLQNQLAKQVEMKEKWRAAAKAAEEKLKEAVAAQKAAEKLVANMEKMAEAKEKAIKVFTDRWEKKYLGAAPKKSVRKKRRGRPRKTAAASAE